jgi:hypothetical protein
MNRWFLYLMLVAGLVFLSGCRKSDRDEDKELQSAEDFGIAQATFADLFHQLDLYCAGLADVNRNSQPGLQNCASVTVNPALPNPSFPKTVSIDFGPVNCAGPDGVLRRGVITAVFSGRYRDSLSTITITPNNFYRNDIRVLGTQVLTNQGRINGVLTYSVSDQNCSLVFPDTKTISWDSNRSRRWINGESTPGDFSDDSYEISGTASGRGTKGNTFTANTVSGAPLLVSMNCRYIKSGKLILKPANLLDREIDFGSGACDDKATVTIAGKTYEITLR